MMLREIAHVRTGDKGDICQISVIAFAEADYPILERHVTVDHIRAHLAFLDIGAIERHELPGLGALNFVLHGALRGGVTRSLALDAHGKTLGCQLLDLDLDIG